MGKVDLTLYLVAGCAGRGDERGFLDIIRKSCEGGVTLVQLREKEKGGLAYLSLAEKVKQITDEYQIPLIIDDRPDIAMAVGAAGVHVGQADVPVRIARGLLGKDRIVGATAKTVEQAVKAEAEGADYLGVGAIFPTTTKVITVITEVRTLNEIAASVKIPVVAIGGLNSSNLHVLYDGRAEGIAVVTAIMESATPYQTSLSLKKQVLENFRQKKKGCEGTGNPGSDEK